MTFEYLISALIVVILPGAGVLYTVAMGLTGGARAGMVAAVGCTVGIVPHLLAGVLGLAAVLHASALAFQVIKFAGVAYLLYLAWSMWRAGGQAYGDLDNPEDGTPPNPGRIVARALLINLLNPKLSIFFLAFLPQFVNPANAQPMVDMALLGLVFMGLTLVVFLGYGLLAGRIREAVLSRPRILARIRRTFAGVFAVLAARLAIAEP